jgi:hypothetical protein
MIGACLPRASEDESRARCDFCRQDFQASTARFGDVHRRDLKARFLAVEETLAGVRTSAQAIEGSEGALRGDTEV